MLFGFGVRRAFLSFSSCFAWLNSNALVVRKSSLYSCWYANQSNLVVAIKIRYRDAADFDHGLLAVLLQPIRHHLAEVFKRYLGRFQLQFVAQYREVRLKPLIPVENVSVKSSGISLFYQRESA